MRAFFFNLEKTFKQYDLWESNLSPWENVWSEGSESWIELWEGCVGSSYLLRLLRGDSSIHILYHGLGGDGYSCYSLQS